MNTEIKFELAHIGINTNNENEAIEAAKLFELMFGLDVKVGNSSVFASRKIEIMKTKFLGEHGHIAMKTQDVNAAKKMFENKGYSFVGNTMKYDNNGDIIAIYFEKEIAGFAIHLLRA